MQNILHVMCHFLTNAMDAWQTKIKVSKLEIDSLLLYFNKMCFVILI
jgi:hypothetical protein